MSAKIKLSKSPVLNANFLKRFQDRINDSNFGILHFSNRKERDDFSAICSCMDWLSVAIDYINSTKIIMDYSNLSSMSIFQFIMAVDIVYNCIDTLHRIICDVNKAPFFTNHHIFNSSKNDNEHFKEIRAAFGAHPTAMNNKGKEKKYASWSSIKSEKYDFIVLLYSSIPGKKSEEYGFNLNDLLKFVIERYNYLEELTIKLDKYDLDFKTIKKNIKIKKTKSLEEKISILKDETIKRFGKYNGYFDDLDLINSMLFPKCTYDENLETINKYKNLLKKVLNRIESNLQNMEIEKLHTNYIIHPMYRPNEVSYDIEKIFEYIYSPNSFKYQMLSFHIDRVKPYLKHIKKITPELDINELLLLLKAGLFFEGKDKKYKLF